MQHILTISIVLVVLFVLVFTSYSLHKWVILTDLIRLLKTNPKDSCVFKHLRSFDLIGTFMLFPGILAGARKILEKDNRPNLINKIDLALRSKKKK
jgi:hypothetical protein